MNLYRISYFVGGLIGFMALSTGLAQLARLIPWVRYVLLLLVGIALALGLMFIGMSRSQEAIARWCFLLYLIGQAVILAWN